MYDTAGRARHGLSVGEDDLGRQVEDELAVDRPE